MSDVAPVNGSTAMFLQCPTTTHQHEQQQSACAWTRDHERGRVGTEARDRFRPSPNPGPGRGSQRPSGSAEEAIGAGACAAQGRLGDQSQVSRTPRGKEDGLVTKTADRHDHFVCDNDDEYDSGTDHSDSELSNHHHGKAKGIKNYRKKDRQSIPSEKLLKPATRLQRHPSSDGSSDSGCSSTSCSNCAELVRALYRENGSLRISLKGLEAITESLNKTREELEASENKNSKLEIAIGNLQSRLHRVGCDTSVDLAEHEIFIPGHDRVFVNNLISENGRLQKELKEFRTRDDAVKINTELEKTVKELESKLRELQDQLRSKEDRISTLEKLQCSEDAKTCKIMHLQKVNLQTSEDLKTAEGLCETLSSETKRLQGEVNSLQHHLSKTSEELASWKEKAQHLESRPLAVCTQKMEVQKESNLSTADRLKIAEGQVEQLDKENSRLTEQLREVIGMNTRWQRYNEQRETHVLKLTKTNQHQHSKITVLEQQQRDLEQTINGLNVMLQQLKDEQKKNTDAAIISLEQQLAQREDRIVELTEEVSALKMYVQTTENDRGIQQRKEDKDMIETLQQQVQIFKDDFEQERRDRERIQGNNEILRHRLQDTSRKLAALELQNSRTASNFSAKVVGSAPVYEQQPRRLLARGLSRPRDYGFDDDSFLPFEVEVDGQDETDGPGSNSEPLQCPRCAQEFAVADHSLFMRHVGICLDQ